VLLEEQIHRGGKGDCPTQKKSEHLRNGNVRDVGGARENEEGEIVRGVRDWSRIREEQTHRAGGVN